MKRSSTLLAGIVLAFQFFTTVPIKKQVQWNEKTARASLLFLPFTGLVLGALLAFFNELIQPTSISLVLFAFFILFLSIVYSGALHLDGWMDVSDAVFSHRDQERRLEIMKDPRVGPFAVISLLFLLGWRFLFLLELVNSEHSVTYFLLAIPFLSRWLMGFLLLIGKSAKNEGLLVTFKPVVNRLVYAVYFVWLFLFVIFTIVVAPTLVVPIVLLVGVVFLIIFCSYYFFERQFGGFTGDTIGAAGEGGETILWLGVWLLVYFVMG